MAAGNNFGEVGGVGVFQAFGFELVDFARAENFHGYAAGIALGVQKAKQRNIDLAVARAARFSTDDEFGGLLDGLEKGYRELAVFHFPVRDRRAGDLVDGDFVGQGDADFARGALRYFDVDLGDDGGGVFAESGEFGERAAEAESLRAAVIFRFAFPRESERLVAAGVGDPFTFGAGLGFFRQEAAGELDVHALAGETDCRARYAGACRRERDAFFAGGGDDGQSDIELQHGAARAREESGKLVGAFSRGAGDERDELAVEFGFANEKSRRNWHAHPAVFEYIDGETGAACGEIAIDVQVIVNARERGVYGRAFGFALRRIGLCVQRSIIADGDYHPARSVRGSLRRGTARAKQERRAKKNCEEPMVTIFVRERNGRT